MVTAGLMWRFGWGILKLGKTGWYGDSERKKQMEDGKESEERRRERN
jgi:hypothetical protein